MAYVNGTYRQGGGPEFSDGKPPLVLGSVIGARHFDVRKDGALTGVVYHREWTAGINVADCRVRLGYRIPNVGISPYVTKVFRHDAPTNVVNENGLYWSVRPGEHIGWKYEVDDKVGILYQEERPEEVHQDWYADDHDFKDCTCGFYSYMKGSMDYADGRRVAGIVEGFGLVVRGTRGFRLQKARIKAIYIPDPPDEAEGWTPRDVDLDLATALRRAGYKSTVSRETRIKIAARYPTIPMFTDLDEMLRAFPTDEPREG